MSLFEIKYKYSDRPEGEGVVTDDPVQLNVGVRRTLELNGTTIPYEVIGEDKVKVDLSKGGFNPSERSVGIYINALEIDPHEALGPSGQIESITAVCPQNGDFVLHLTTGNEAVAVALLSLAPRSGELI